jgi:hypothetical protein
MPTSARRIAMPSSLSPKRERELKDLEHKFKQNHRYQGREDEVAARIVNKQRAKFGETKSAKQQDKEGKSPDRDLPIRDYQSLTIAQADKKLSKLSTQDLRKIRTYETRHKNRKGMLAKIDRQMGNS